jgi:hypothetical protein
MLKLVGLNERVQPAVVDAKSPVREANVSIRNV